MNKTLQQAQHPDSTSQGLQESSSVIQAIPDDDDFPSIQETPSGDSPILKQHLSAETVLPGCCITVKIPSRGFNGR